MSEISNNEVVKLKQEFFKYLAHWKYFLFSTLITFFLAILFLVFTPKKYASQAKVKILSEKEYAFSLPSVNDIFSGGNQLNLENEMEIMKSYPILLAVVERLDLNVEYFDHTNLVPSKTEKLPFEVLVDDSIRYFISNPLIYEITIDDSKLTLESDDLQKTYNLNKNKQIISGEFPFVLKLNNSIEGKFKLIINPVKQIIQSLKESIAVKTTGKQSDIISLSLQGHNPRMSELILNTLIDEFNKDGIKDRQLIQKRTIDFVNGRYSILSSELETIELQKQEYLSENDLINLEYNSVINLELNSKSTQELFEIEKQSSLAKGLLSDLENSEIDLIPANIGLQNSDVNLLINDYNTLVLERNKLVMSAGSNNPTLIQSNVIIDGSKNNIIASLNSYIKQLEGVKTQLSSRSEIVSSSVSSLPENEKILRSINRSQMLKEQLYLFLLQKKEEAEVSYAITAPSVKVVEYAISGDDPISPRPKLVLLYALLFGLFVPFVTVYFFLLFQTKIKDKKDFDSLEDINIPLVAEVPMITEGEDLLINEENRRSTLGESFRLFTSNLNFIRKADNKSNVILVSSANQGEGKTFCSANLAITYSSLGKKVLLIGADLYNPQVHNTFNVVSSEEGLSNVLIDKTFDWRKAITNPLKNQKDLDVLMSGALPPNPTKLIINGNLDVMLEDAKKVYDYIIIDCPPVRLVSDTVNISHLSDMQIFVTRIDVTEKEDVYMIQKAFDERKYSNPAILLNGCTLSLKYNYGYTE